MNAALKIGNHCIRVPMFCEAAPRRAGPGRIGEPLRRLAEGLRHRGECRAIVLGAGYGERLADLASGGIETALGVEALGDRFALLEVNAARLGGVAVRAYVAAGPIAAARGEAARDDAARRGAGDTVAMPFSALLASLPEYRDSRLLLIGGSQDGPSAIESALSWVAATQPILGIEITLPDDSARERWQRVLARLPGLGYAASAAFDAQDHPLGGLGHSGGADLLTWLDSARRYGGGMTLVTLYLATAGDSALLEGVRERMDRRDEQSVPRIAVVRLDNLGDHVLGAGIFRALRGHYPQSKLVAVIPAPLADLYERCPLIDALLPLPPVAAYSTDGAQWAELLRHLQGCEKFDIVVNPRFAEDYYGAGAIGASIASPRGRLIGFRQTRSPLANYDPNAYYRELIEASASLHAAQYADLVAAAVTGHTVCAPPEAWFDSQDWSRVARRFDVQRGEYAVVGIGASFPFKRPTLDIYRAVLRALRAARVRIILVGSEADASVAEALQAADASQETHSSRAAAECSRDVISAVAQLRLCELAALLQHACLYVGPDAGPKHIAAALGTAVVELAWVPPDYPATSRGPGTGGACWSAWKTRSRTVHPSRAAFDRSSRDSSFQRRPITGIDPNEVERAIGELLDR